MAIVAQGSISAENVGLDLLLSPGPVNIIHCVTKVLLPFDFLCNIGDVEIACWLQNKVCRHSLLKHGFLKLYLEVKRWQYLCSNVICQNIICPLVNFTNILRAAFVPFPCAKNVQT